MTPDRIVRMLVSRYLFRFLNKGIDAWARRTNADPKHVAGAKRAAKLARQARRVRRF